MSVTTTRKRRRLFARMVNITRSVIRFLKKMENKIKEIRPTVSQRILGLLYLRDHLPYYDISSMLGKPAFTQTIIIRLAEEGLVVATRGEWELTPAGKERVEQELGNREDIERAIVRMMPKYSEEKSKLQNNAEARDVAARLIFNKEIIDDDEIIAEIRKEKPNLSGFDILIGLNEAKRLQFKPSYVTDEIRKEIELWEEIPD